jgi:ABC-type multidrug transport system ATPase subunit
VGSFFSCSCIASHVFLIGPPVIGSGKSTLLNTLACREVEAPRTFTGEIYLNGVRLHSKQRKSVRYVPQSDIYWTQLSIREHLTYVAQLRIGTGEGASDAPGDNSIESARLAQVYRAACVTAVMDQLCLSHCADTAILHLSGGEKKRVSVATELLDQCQRSLAPMLPKVLLLGEH